MNEKISYLPGTNPPKAPSGPPEPPDSRIARLESELAIERELTEVYRAIIRKMESGAVRPHRAQ